MPAGASNCHCHLNEKYRYHSTDKCHSHWTAGNGSVPAHWSLEYQRVVDYDSENVAMTDELIAGLALWQFCDIKVDSGSGVQVRLCSRHSE